MQVASRDESARTTSAKNSILQETASFCDQLGFLSPLLIPTKIQLRGPWKLQLNWDCEAPLTPYIQRGWNKIAVNIDACQSVSIPRLGGHTTSTSINKQLHAFCRTFAKSYGTAAYLREQGSDGWLPLRLSAKPRPFH